MLKNYILIILCSLCILPLCRGCLSRRNAGETARAISKVRNVVRETTTTAAPTKEETFYIKYTKNTSTHMLSNFKFLT